MNYDIFISYRKKVSGDKPELLWQILEHSGYKSRVSFDKDNLTGEFNPSLIKRIDNCKDFILLVLPNTFDECNPNNEHAANFYRDLTNLPIEKILEEVKRLEGLPKEELSKEINWEGEVKDAHIDYLRIEVNRALNRKTKNNESRDFEIIPITYLRSEKYSFSSLDLPSDLRPIKNYQAIFYSDSEEERFNRIVPDLKRRLTSKPAWGFFKYFLVGCMFVLCCLGGGLIWEDYKLYNKCSSIKDYTAYLAEGQGVFSNRAESKIEEIKDALSFSISEESIRTLTERKDYTHLTQLQAEALNEILSNMIFVEGATFLMGSQEEDASRKEKPQHEAVVEDFYIGRFEVSRYEWNAIKGIAPTNYSRDSLDVPITNISWSEVQQWIATLNELSGLNFGLPHEKEWEYAAKEGCYDYKDRYAGSNNLKDVAWSSADTLNAPRPRQRDGVTWYRESNELGLYNMSGNVAEMCSNEFYYYDTSKSFLGIDKVTRGGSYDSPITLCTVTSRDLLSATVTSPSIGFRLILRNNSIIL